MVVNRVVRSRFLNLENKKYILHFWNLFHCYSVSCRSTGRCDSSAEVVKRKTSCCDGFAINPASTSHKYAILRREGCTIRKLSQPFIYSYYYTILFIACFSGELCI